MSKESLSENLSGNLSELKPFVSVIIIIATSLVAVFCKMEVRRMGYVVWKKSRLEKTLREDRRRLSVQLAQQQGSGRVGRFAHAHTKDEDFQAGEVVYITGDASGEQVALRQ